jgi:hypothetical protein
LVIAPIQETRAMMRKLVGLTLTLSLTITAGLLADSPQIASVTPFGIQRGVATDLTISGANLKGKPRIIASFGFQLDPAAVNDQDPANLKVKLTAAAETPVGVYPVRVQTEGGLSNPFLVSIGQVPEIAEQEDNNQFDKAQTVPALVAVQGQCAGNDVDFFKFPGKKGQRVLVDAQCARIGSGLDPQIRLTTASRKFVASADDSPGLITDARLVAELPEDADYVVEISDSKYQGANRPAYRLLIGPIPTADEAFPVGGQRGQTVAVQLRGGNLPAPVTIATELPSQKGIQTVHPRLPARILPPEGIDPELDIELPMPLVVGELPEINEPAEPPKGQDSLVLVAPPIVINGRMDPANDEDRYLVSVSPGQKLRVSLQAAEVGSTLDAELRVLGAKDAQIAKADDTPLTVYPNVRKKVAAKKADFVSADATTEVTVPQGLREITVVVRDLEARGGIGFPYRLVIEPSEPSFELWLDESEVTIPRGGFANLYVTVTRAGYNGPIALSIPNLPPGLTTRASTIPEGQTVGLVTLNSAQDASGDLVNLIVQGEGKGPRGPIVRPARRAVVFAQQLALPTKVVIQEEIPVAAAVPARISLETPPTTVEVAHGTQADLPVRIQRADGADAALTLSPVTALPKGVALAESKVAEKASQAKVSFKVEPEAPLGPQVIGLEAKGKVDGKDHSYDVPVVLLEVVRPITVEVASASGSIKPGDKWTIQGKIRRQGGFRDPVTIKIEGLPKGLKAEPVTLEGDATEFLLEVTADSDAPQAKAEAKLAPAFQINKKDYATPPTSITIQVEKPADNP